MDCSSAPRRPRPGARTDSGVVSIGETPGSGGGPGQSHGRDVYGNLRPYQGVWRSKPLTLEQKGVLIAAGTLAFPFLATGGRLGLLAWKLRPLTIPIVLSPGGGGPGQSLTSTEPLSERDYRLMYGSY